MNWEEFCRNADRLLFRQVITKPHQNQRGECVMSQATMAGVINGVNLERMGATVQAVRQNASLARFQLRALNRWITGGHNRSIIQSFYGAGQEDTTRTYPFVVEADVPPVLVGENHAPAPAEYVLHALAGCLTTSLVYHAATRGIRIESVESKVEGDLDLQGFLGISNTVRPGYKEIRVKFTVRSDAKPEQLQGLMKYSLVYDIVANPVPVVIQIEPR
jgi:uncharacterized OsmC-like protein